MSLRLLELRRVCRIPTLTASIGYQANHSSFTRFTHSSASGTKEYRVTLDNGTLYIDQELAEALGWDSTKKESVPLALNGWAPTYFTIARTGTDSEILARQTAESGRNAKVKQVLEYLKDR